MRYNVILAPNARWDHVLFSIATGLVERPFTFYAELALHWLHMSQKLVPGLTVKILKFGTPQTIAIIVLKIEKFDVTLH